MKIPKRCVSFVSIKWIICHSNWILIERWPRERATLNKNDRDDASWCEKWLHLDACNCKCFTSQRRNARGKRNRMTEINIFRVICLVFSFKLTKWMRDNYVWCSNDCDTVSLWSDHQLVAHREFIRDACAWRINCGLPSQILQFVSRIFSASESN